MPQNDRVRRGSALLEVLVGMVLLAVACVAWITLAGQTARTLRRLHETEALSRAASTEMERVGVMPSGGLDALRGTSRHGRFDVRVARISPALFDVVVADTLTGADVAHTALYRPDASP